MAGYLTAISDRNHDAVLGGYQWEIEVSRFFSYPRVSLFSSTANLKPRSASRSGSYGNDGTWISSSSAALLCLLPNPPAILTVSIQGKIHMCSMRRANLVEGFPIPSFQFLLQTYLLFEASGFYHRFLLKYMWTKLLQSTVSVEEHFVSNLHFSWPQLSCGAGCPIRGSRVVFASYRDSASQIQKFALRFFSSQDAQTFLDATEESLKNSLEMVYPRDDEGCEKSSHLEDTASNEIVHYRAEEMGFTNTDTGYHPEMQTSSFEGEQHVCFQPLLLANNVDSVFSSLTPIFASLPTSCSAENFEEVFKTPMDEDFLSKMTKYLLDSSFHDMLGKVEKIIDDMGGNLLHYSHPDCF